MNRIIKLEKPNYKIKKKKRNIKLNEPNYKIKQTEI